MNIEEILLLKRSFCEFITKLLPTIKDPSILTRTRWHQFRNILLDDHKSTTDIYNYVKELSFSESIKINTDTRINHSPKSVNQEQIRVQQTINQQLKTENREVFVKQPSKRKLSIKMKQERQPDTANYQPMDSIQRVNYQTGKVDNFSIIQNKRQEKFQKDKILDQLNEEIAIFKKHGQTLGTVYNKSFEINTSDLDQTAQQNINCFSANRQAQMDLIQLQNASRNATLKGYSIYAKKDKEVAKQRVDEYAQNYNNQKKVYM